MADVHYDIHEYQGYLSNQAVTIAELLKLKGYNTYFSGKWHVGDKAPQIPSKRGFPPFSVSPPPKAPVQKLIPICPWEKSVIPLRQEGMSEKV